MNHLYLEVVDGNSKVLGSSHYSIFMHQSPFLNPSETGDEQDIEFRSCGKLLSSGKYWVSTMSNILTSKDQLTLILDFQNEQYVKGKSINHFEVSFN